jgi:Glucodextranase, domain B
MARYRAERRLRGVSAAFAASSQAVERRWRRIRLWFRRQARDNLILAVLATIGGFVARPFSRYRKRTRNNVVFGTLAIGGLALLAVVFFTGRGGPGTRLVRAAEPPTTAIESTTSTEAELAPAVPRDTIPPPLLLDPTLTDGLQVGTNHIVVGGVTDPGAKVVVAGIELTADDSGAWAADVPLALGGNRIEVIATDDTGNATGAVFTVVYVVDAPPPPAPKKPKPIVVTTTSTVAPTSTTRAATTTSKKTTSTATTPTSLGSTTTRSTSTTTEGVGIGVLFPTVPTTAHSTTTVAPTTTAATTTTNAATTTAATTTEAPTTTQPTTTEPDTTPTTEPDTTPTTG